MSEYYTLEYTMLWAYKVGVYTSIEEAEEALEEKSRHEFSRDHLEIRLSTEEEILNYELSIETIPY